MSEPENIPEGSPLLAYATPSPLAGQGDLFRDGGMLVARDGVTLGEVCVLCGEAGWGKPLRLKFTWDSSFQVTRGRKLELRASGSVRARLCARHLGRWKSGRALGAAGMAVSLMLMLASVVVAVISESSDVPRYVPLALGGLLAGFGLFIGFMFLFALRTRTLRCRRIEQGYLYLEGAGSGFLEGVAELPRAKERG